MNRKTIILLNQNYTFAITLTCNNLEKLLITCKEYEKVPISYIESLSNGNAEPFIEYLKLLKIAFENLNIVHIAIENSEFLTARIEKTIIDACSIENIKVLTVDRIFLAYKRNESITNIENNIENIEGEESIRLIGLILKDVC